MAERNEKVYERVRQELEKTPALGSRVLYEMAQQADKAIGQQTLQQFHARYVLPIKREQAKRAGGGRSRKAKRGRKAKAEAPTASAKSAPKRGGRPRKRVGVGGRDQARAVLLRFAQDFAAAETKPQIVKVMSRIDDYVDEIAGTAS